MKPYADRVKWYANPAVAGKWPVVAMFLLEYSNVAQIWQMWHTRTAAGQNLWAWVSVGVATLGFCWFYRVCCPQERLAFWATWVGVGLNACVVGSVVYFKYVVR